MKTFGQEVKEKAEFPSDKITNLRYDLISEELAELKEAIDTDIKKLRHWPTFYTCMEQDMHSGLI